MPSASTARPYSCPLIRCFSMAPSTMSHTASMSMLSDANSSAMIVSVAPAARPMPSARCPALRPMALTKYQRLVVRASSRRFRAKRVPRSRAVSYPKVGAPSGSGRSLSMVLGICTERSAPPPARDTSRALNAVSSPPMVTRRVMPSSSRVATVRCRSAALRVGLAREVRRMAPPCTWTRDTSAMRSGVTRSVRPCMRCEKPS